MASLMTAHLRRGSSIWITVGVAIGVGLLLIASGFVVGNWTLALPGMLVLSRDSFETWVVIGMGGLISSLIIFMGVTRIRLGQEDVREGIAKRFRGPMTLERSFTTSDSVNRTTYAVLLPGTKLVRARSDVAEPLFTRHAPAKSWSLISGTETARVSFEGSVDFAPHSQFIFRLTDDPEAVLIDPPSA
jgi:hypothetical protein